MKRQLFRLIFVIIPLFIISACNDSQQEQKSKVNNIIQQQNDCVNEVSGTLNQLGSIAAQGCPVK